jgi:Cdc6-like AAA superfamily ATPase
MPVLLREWFALNRGRDSFKPNNINDSRLIFCHSNIVTKEILGNIEQRFAANEPVKMLIYGDWGVGKTHTIYHIKWWFDQHKAEYPITCLVIQVGDITKTTRFDSIVGRFVDKIGINGLVGLVYGYLQRHSNVSLALQEKGVPVHIANALTKLLLAPPGQTPPPVAAVAVDYLKGRKLSSEATAMGLGSQITESDEFFQVLNAIGTMHLEVHGHRLLFIADEAARLEAVEANETTQNHWVNVNNLIFDDNNTTFGFIYTISGRRDQLPQALAEPQIRNRLGDSSMCELKNLAPADVGQFLRSLVEEFVDRAEVERRVGEKIVDQSEYVWETYPFTTTAREEFVDYFSRAQENSKPRDITNKLDDVAFIAAKSSKRLIDSACLQQAGM